MEENSDKYTIRIVQSMAEFLKLEYEWNRLIENCKYHVPFLSFDWFRIWLNHFLGDNELFIILIYDENKLAAIAPFTIKDEKFKRVIKTRKIELIGNVHAPIRNFIFDEREDNTKVTLLYEILLKLLESEFNDWDILELDSIPEELRSLNIIRTAVELTGLKSREYFCFNDWTLEDINFSGDEYMSGKPKNLRKELGKRRRRLERNGQLRFEIESDRKSYDYYKKIYYEVRNKSWKHPERDIVFLDDFRRNTFDRGWLRYASLFFNNSPISCHLRLSYRDEVYFLESVYDREYAEYSPTTILRSELMKYVIDKEKVATIHTIKGDEAYKRDWTPQRRERRGIAIFNNTLKGQILAFVMTKVLPIVEKYPRFLLLKNKLARYVRNYLI